MCFKIRHWIWSFNEIYFWLNKKYPNILTFDFDAKAETDKESENLKEKVKPICKCPKCNSNIIETPFNFKCENKDCRVLINKKIPNVKKWTKKAISELLKDGITSTRLTVITKKGTEMDVYLKYSFDSSLEYPNKVEIVFDKEDKHE